ncbi:MAG: hypothetical protein M9915_08715, partial [Rhizobacter sp.]|nr:hypothetical protein [Rhizobacter sp.]
VRRPRNHEPPAGTAWCDAQALNPLAGNAWRDAKALDPPAATARRDAKAHQFESSERTATKARQQASAPRLMHRGPREVRWSN